MLINKKKRERSSFIRRVFRGDVLEFETSARAQLCYNELDVIPNKTFLFIARKEKKKECFCSMFYLLGCVVILLRNKPMTTFVFRSLLRNPLYLYVIIMN